MPKPREAASVVRPRARRATALVTVVIAAVALAGCGAQPKPAPSATALPAGVTATLLPATPAQDADEVRLWVENTTAEDLSLSRIRIDDPAFDGIGRKATSGAVQVAAGQSAEIVVALPAISCEADAAASPTPAAGATPAATPAPGDGATATIGFALGAAIGIAVTPIADPEGVVASRVTVACG